MYNVSILSFPIAATQFTESAELIDSLHQHGRVIHYRRLVKTGMIQ